jgi:hypothetical protein
VVKRETLVLLSILCGVLVGCGDSGFQLVPVSGQLTFDGKPAPAGGTISFTPMGDTGTSDLPRRIGSAIFNTDGNFVVSSYKKDDGLMPGRYTVKIVCWVGTPSERNPKSYIDLDRVPQDYRPDLTVEKGSAPMVVKYDIPPKK